MRIIRRCFLSGLLACKAGETSRTRILACFALVYGCSLAALRWMGLRPAVPLSFIPSLVLIGAPLTVCAVYLESMLEGRRRSVRLAAGALLAVAALLWYRSGAIYCLIAALLLPYTRAVRWNASTARSILFGIAALIIGFGAVWNLNYLAAAATAARVHDQPLLEFDRRVYSLLSGGNVEAAGMFPLVTNGTAVRVFENAYVILFPEMILAVALLSLRARAGQLERFLLALFASYGCAVVVFLAWPVVGPPIYRPETFSGAFANSLTRQLMRGMASEYHNTVTRSALNGFGYFIAIPSLHVIDAVLLQWFFRKASRVLQYAFLPVNVMVALSTLVLGYHYLADVAAALVVAAMMILVFDSPWNSRPSSRRQVSAHFAPARIEGCSTAR